MPAQLALKRPVICSFKYDEYWFDKKVSKTGLIDFVMTKGAMPGETVGVIISWNPVNEQIKLLTPWVKWGNKGVAVITKDAMEHVRPRNLRVIEAVEKPSPYSKPLLDLSNKMAAENRKKPRKVKA